MSTLPIDEIDEPLRGYKFAEVRGTRSPRVHPSGKYWRRGYEHRHTATAECHPAGHTAPTVACTAGLSAVRVGMVQPTEHLHAMLQSGQRRQGAGEGGRAAGHNLRPPGGRDRSIWEVDEGRT